MLRIGLVLLLATSAFAASLYDDIVIDLVSDNAIAKNTGRANHLTDYLSSLVDGGDKTINIVTLEKITNDIASLRDVPSQVLGLSHSIVTSMTLAYGAQHKQGPLCLAADLVNAFPTGNYGQALRSFINVIAKNLNTKIVKLKQNPESLRFSSSLLGNCDVGVSSNKIEAAWSTILSNATPSNVALLDEVYCTVKRLHRAHDVRSSNLGIMVTAISLPPVQAIFRPAYPRIIEFANALSGNGNVNAAVSALQQALLRAV